MRQKFYQFMYGRNGADQYSRFLTYAALVFIILDLLLRYTDLGGVCWYIAIVLMVYAYFRVFSRKLEKRRAENARFLQMKTKLILCFTLL